jgi:hypothetical protein
VIAEIHHSSFCVFVFVCDFHLESSSFFGKSFPFLFYFFFLYRHYSQSSIFMVLRKNRLKRGEKRDTHLTHVCRQLQSIKDQREHIERMSF